MAFIRSTWIVPPGGHHWIISATLPLEESHLDRGGVLWSRIIPRVVSLRGRSFGKSER